VPVREVAGTEVYQTYIGSSANPGYRDVIRWKVFTPRSNPARRFPVKNLTRKLTFVARHSLSDRQVDLYMAGGLINWKKGRLTTHVAIS